MNSVVALASVAGAVFGSFLNVVIHRVPLGQSVVKPPSHCPGCQSPVRPRDNVPVLSWLALKGRCRHCGERISWRYPLIEALTAILFAAVVVARGPDLELLVELPFVAVMVAVAVIDLEHRIVPNKILLPAAIWAVGASAVVQPDRLPELLVAGAAAFTLLLLAALAHPAGMGMGDVKLAGVMGLYLGSAVAPALFVGFLTGSLVGVGMIAKHGAGARKRGVPFAPFLAVGGVVGTLAGAELVDLYAVHFL
jgi:leader peptidase (prepilin peptidase)/N-methyltransferase